MSEKDLNNQTQADRDDNNYDTLYKIRPFLDLINNSFKAAFTPYQSISVDESIIGFKAWLSWVQYMQKSLNGVSNYGLQVIQQQAMCGTSTCT